MRSSMRKQHGSMPGSLEGIVVHVCQTGTVVDLQGLLCSATYYYVGLLRSWYSVPIRRSSFYVRFTLNMQAKLNLLLARTHKKPGLVVRNTAMRPRHERRKAIHWPLVHVSVSD